METPQPVNQPARTVQSPRNKAVLRETAVRSWPEQLLHTCEVCGKERMSNEFWAKRGEDRTRRQVTVCKTCVRELVAVFNSEIGKLSGEHVRMGIALLQELMKKDPDHPVAAEALRIQAKRQDLVNLRASLRADLSDVQRIRRLRQAVGLPCT